MSEKGYIYKITNQINKKEYIGCTIYPLKRRFEAHAFRCIKTDSNTKFCNSIRKYGIENFEKEILETFNTEEKMNEAEKRCVVLGEGSYNIRPGGYGGWTYVNINGLNIHPWTDERLKKHSETASRIRKEQLLIEENRIKFKELTVLAHLKIKELYPNGIWYGRKHSEETLQKLRKSKNVGSDNPQYGTIWITNGIENKKIKKDLLDEFNKLGYYKGRIT